MSSRYDRKRHQPEDSRGSRDSKYSRDSRDYRDTRNNETVRDDRNQDRDRNRGYEKDRRDDRHRQDNSKGTTDKYDKTKKSTFRNDRYYRDEEKDRRRTDHRENEKYDRRDNRRERLSTKSPSDSRRSRESSEKPKNVPDDTRLFDRILDPNYKKKSSNVLEIEDVEMSPIELKPEEDEISTFTFDDACGPSKPTKEVVMERESSPEPESEEKIEEEERPETSSTYSDTEELDDPLNKTVSDDENVADDSDKYNVTPDPEDWDELPDAEKILHKQAQEKRKQNRHDEAVSKLPVYYPGLKGCQHIAEYAILNVIAEGTYGEVFRGKNTRTDEIVALKRFKMEEQKNGFPITALREINMLLKAGSHENVVNVKEMLVGRKETEVFMAMEYVEHDVKSLIDKMKAKNQRFRTGQQKTLMLQLLSGIEHMHNLWILHRDLKTSNLLISHSGVLKIADFGLAREFGDAPDIENRMKLTPVVVTLWYRAIELLLQPKTYSTPVDMWSVGCIMAEFILMSPLFKGGDDPNQVDLIFQMLGTPNETTWPGIQELNIWQSVEFQKYKSGALKKLFRGEKLLNDSGFDLLSGLLTMDPKKRLTASEALNHQWFNEHPVAVPRDELPTYPANSEFNVSPPKKKRTTRLEALLADEDPERAALLRQFNVKADQVKTSDFQLKF